MHPQMHVADDGTSEYEVWSSIEQCGGDLAMVGSGLEIWRGIVRCVVETAWGRCVREVDGGERGGLVCRWVEVVGRERPRQGKRG